MSSPYPVLDNKPIDQWRVTELKDELKRRKLTTRGLKDDLIRRLDEAMRAEMDSNAEDSVCNESELNKNEANHTAENINSVGEAVHNEYSAKEVANGFDSNLEPQGISKDLIAKSNKSQMVEDIEKQVLEVNEDATKMDIVGSLNNVSTKMEVVEDVMVDGSVKIQEVDKNAEKVETVGSVEIQDGESTVTSDSMGLVGQAVERSVSVETKTITTEAFIVKIASSGQDFQNTEIIVENEDQKLPHDDAVLSVSNPDNQVSEVCPALGFQVNSESISTDSVSINEKNELKDNLNADNSLIELEVVKPEMVQPSSSDVPFEGGNMLHENQNAVGETCDNDTTNVDFNRKNYSAEGESSEKLNLDRSSGDDSMEEDILESKLSDSKNDNDAEVGEKNEVLSVKEEMSVDGMEVGSSLRKNDNLENSTPAEKRKLEDKHVAVNNEPVKRQRQWNTESVKIPEVQTSTITASTTPKDAIRTVPKRKFTRSDSTLNGRDTPKERVVPPPLRSPTNSLRINNFLRPFTLKAVQELLAKTGTVSIFWMDHIKTHCYVMYSSVEEATETRNALYNLQWPVNGGKLLAAEFVKPEEVKQAEASQSLASPVGVSSSIKPSAPAPFQPSPRHQDLKPSRQQELKPSPHQQDLKPSPRQQDLMQKLLPPPPLPPLPPLSDPPAAREQIQLPPPPPLLKKPDPPIVTLDDLFKKTRATPRIYYLPLSEEQVAAKLLRREKNMK